MIWFALACLLHLVAGFFYISSGLIAPLWAVLVLIAIWIGLAVLLVRRRRTGPETLLIPVLAGATWFVLISLGEMFLGWRG
ncbi:MAG TPA: hypothetical protein VJ927_09175 [Actinomycetota bacterium]|nr:hypothetical protein [Actinomycetota bacterium]